jgi:hypothetical protein
MHDRIFLFSNIKKVKEDKNHILKFELERTEFFMSTALVDLFILAFEIAAKGIFFNDFFRKENKEKN